MTRHTATRLWRLPLAAALSLVLALATHAQAELTLPSILGENMVLQQGKELPFWGWTEPGQEVTVSAGDAKGSAKADDRGRWLVKLPPLKAGGPITVTIVAGKDKRQFSNVLVGEVWLCSGQSNMEWSVQASANPQQEIAAAEYPRIRLFDTPRRPAGTPQDRVPGQWVECSPQTVPSFSAVAYFFGRHLHKELDVPIGLLESSWGGTRIEPWTPPEGFEAVTAVAGIHDNLKTAKAAYEKAKGQALDAFAKWVEQARAAQAAGGPIPEPPAWPQDPAASHVAPTGLYNGMIHPHVPFAIRGALWYQGESNLGEGMLYHEKMKALIAGWRKVWGDPEMPFYFVQLAPFRYGNASPTALPEIWEAQAATLAVPYTGMAGTVDIGNVGDIHPKNKQDVGKRLALWALAKDYGRKDLVYSGPLFKSAKVEGSTVRVSFDHVGGGLVSRDGKPLSRWELAGEDGKFEPAIANIEDDTVVVRSELVEKPKYVRFGWHQEAEPNLSNKEGLPAIPFRTDR